MADWFELTNKRTQDGKHFAKTGSSKRTFQQVIRTALHYGSHPDAVDFANEVDMRQETVDISDLDGFQTKRAGMHFALGHFKHNNQDDGWFSVAGRQGESNIGLKFHRVGVMDWRSKQFRGILGNPNYDRNKMAFTPHSLDIGIGDALTSVNASNIAEWKDIWQGVDLRFLLDGRKIKTEVEFSALARQSITSQADITADNLFTLIFQLDTGLMGQGQVAKLRQGNADKSIVQGVDDSNGEVISLVDGHDRLLGQMPLDVAYGERYFDGKRYEQDQVDLIKRLYIYNGKSYLMVGARMTDIQSMRDGSIVFDPTFEEQPSSATSKDNFLDANSSTTNRNTSPRLRCDQGTFHTLIEFDCSSIPDDATCDTATLTLNSEDNQSGTHTYDIYSLTSTVESWTANTSNWTNYKVSTAWPGSSGGSTSGTDYEATKLGDITYPISSINTDATASLTASRIEGWFGATNTNYGLIIGVTGSTSTREWQSSQDGVAAYRPKITIEYTEAGGGTTNQAVDGTLSFAGVPTKQTSTTKGGSLSFAGVTLLVTSYARSLSGVISSSGALQTQVDYVRSLAGALSFSGSTSTVKTFLLNLSGALSYSGALSRLTSLSPDGSLSFSGSLSRANSFVRAIAGVLSFSGSETKQTSKDVSGSLSFAGTIQTVKTFLLTLAGSLSLSGSITRLPQKVLSGAISPTGNTLKQMALSLAGSLSSNGAVVTVKTFLLSLVGALSFNGDLGRETQKSLTGTLSFAGSIAKVIQKTFGGSISFGGVVATANAYIVALAGAISPSGTVSTIKMIMLSLAGAISPSGGLTKLVSKSLSGVISFAGSVAANIASSTVAVRLKARYRSLNLTARKRY